MKLITETTKVGDYISGCYEHVFRVENGRSHTYPLTDLNSPAPPDHVRKAIEGATEVVVGYGEQHDLDFLRWAPNAQRVWIMSAAVKNIDGLLSLTRLVDLAIDRPICRMDILGELIHLRKLYIDDWRPGAESVFNLPHLEVFGVQKFPYRDLTRISSWNRLRELWINAGKLDSLEGIPTGLTELRLTCQRYLVSIQAVAACASMDRVTLDGCASIRSVAGLEGCPSLRMLSVIKCGDIDSLEPLRGLRSLEFVGIADGTVVTGNVEALYTLPSLKTLIIARKSGVDVHRLRQVVPSCEIRITTR